jgi:hypothetical protein
LLFYLGIKKPLTNLNQTFEKKLVKLELGTHRFVDAFPVGAGDFARPKSRGGKTVFKSPPTFKEYA